MTRHSVRNTYKRGGSSSGVGSGATGFGVSAYTMDPKAVQSPDWGTSNRVATNANACMTGGKRRSSSSNRKHRRLGGTTLLDMSVPVALFAANQLYRPRRSTARHGNKFNRTRRMSRKHRGGRIHRY